MIEILILLLLHLFYFHNKLYSWDFLTLLDIVAIPNISAIYVLATAMKMSCCYSYNVTVIKTFIQFYKCLRELRNYVKNSYKPNTFEVTFTDWFKVIIFSGYTQL